MQYMTDREVAAAQRVHAQLRQSRVGLRWERIFRRHQQEIESLVAVRPDVREDLWAALHRLGAVASDGSVDDTFTSAAARALDDLERYGGIILCRDAQRLRDELSLASGRSLAQVLGG
jgi:hypothetical protein